MAYLFIDSTYDISLGVLDENFSWIDFQFYSGQRASSIIQVKSFEMLKAHGLSSQELRGLFIISGPGFYTGLRLSEGLADIFRFFGIPAYSFYSYDIPKLAGVKRGVWLTKAYRGEYFTHHWNEEQSKNSLVSHKDLVDHLLALKEDPIFIQTETSIDDHCVKLINEKTICRELLLKHSSEIFSFVKGKTVESFYFRAPEDEFRTAQ